MPPNPTLTILLKMSLALAFLAFTFIPLPRSVKRLHATITFKVVTEDGHLQTPPKSLRKAVYLAERAFNVLQINTRLGVLVSTILFYMRQSLDPCETGPVPPSLHEWRSWLRREELCVVFSPYLNCTRWGWVIKDELRYVMKILLDLAQLAEETPAGYLLRPIHFHFCLAVTLLHEFTNLITKFAFPHEITPTVAGTILRFGEAGEGFEHDMLGGKLVCEWDDGHVADLKHLRRLLLRSLDEDPMDYVLEEEDIVSFVENFCNPTPDTVFEFNLEQKQPSVTPPGTIRTSTQDDRERLRGVGKGTGKKRPPPSPPAVARGRIRTPAVTPPGRIRTGPMLGIGKCYDRTNDRPVGL